MKISKKIILVLLCFTILFCMDGCVGESSSSDNVETCNICGGGMRCEICGKYGPYCENASYGAGSDHYCSEHWADVCEWHERK